MYGEKHIVLVYLVEMLFCEFLAGFVGFDRSRGCGAALHFRPYMIVVSGRPHTADRTQ